MLRWVSLVIVAIAASVVAMPQARAERTAVIAVDLGPGIPEFVRAKATSRAQDGLTAAGFEVLALDQVKAKLAANLATCRDGACLKQVGDALAVPLLLTGSITRKDESTIIVFKLFEAKSGESLAEIHEVCDLCGQDELEERIGVAASALRAKAEAAKAKRTGAPATTGGPVTGKIVVAIVPSVVVNLDTARVDALTQELATAIGTELLVDAKAGLEVRRELPAEGVPADCSGTPSCTADVAKKLGATQLLFVVMVATGSQLQIDTTWVEPASGRTSQRPPIDVANMNDAKSRFEAAAPQLLPDAARRPKAGAGSNMVMGGAVPMHFTTPAKITAGVAGAALVTGIVLGITTRGKYNDCESTPGSCQQAQEDSIRNFGLAADLSFLVATAAGVATIVLFATSGEKAHLVVAPTEGGGGMVSMFGSF